ncbi:MAG TPA: TraR/DksA family transcriptional regulator [Casimicrobiaceae bacterium]|nr:TraR/DksA family transcriptional regulator [Casimicrobiaceae bacterium]
MTVVRNHERRASRGDAAIRPEPKRLSQRELRDLVHRLDTREQALQVAIAEERRRIDTEALSQLDAEVGDQVDQAFVITSVEMERGLIDRYTQELERIAAVRERLANGVFGVCVDCGEPIGAARLQAQPTAVRCTDCQWRHEKIVDIATGATVP